MKLKFDLQSCRFTELHCLQNCRFTELHIISIVDFSNQQENMEWKLWTITARLTQNLY